MSTILLGIGALWVAVFYLAWFVRICLRFHWALIVVMVLLFMGPGVFLAVAPLGLLSVMGFFYAFQKWEPMRGVFQIPRWPRAPIFRGPGRRRPREFREPMPWLRGPNTY